MSPFLSACGLRVLTQRHSWWDHLTSRVAYHLGSVMSSIVNDYVV